MVVILQRQTDRERDTGCDASTYLLCCLMMLRRAKSRGEEGANKNRGREREGKGREGGMGG